MYKCASFFSGVGGIDLGFCNEKFKICYSNEIDKYAVDTFEKNFNIKVDNRDIREVCTEDIPDFDIMLAGFPCQAFSLAGNRQGFEDEKGRGKLFFELERIFAIKKPKVIFLENVKNLVGHDNGNTFRIILKTLENHKYKVKYQVMNSMHYANIPQNRERIYIVAFREKKHYNKFDFPNPVELNKSLQDFIDFKKKQDDKYYYKKETCKFYEKLDSEIKHEDTIYQWRRIYVRENKSNVCPTLTANMGTGGHNVPIILTKYGIRKLTPRECFNLQGFSENFKLPKNLSNTRLYKQAGNSVVVPIIERIAENIKNALI